MPYNPEFRDHYEALKRNLLELRPLFSLDGNQLGYLQYFDEELDANEFEIALHALCNFLLEPTTPETSPKVIEKVEVIHQMMELEDGCGLALRAKSKAKDLSDGGKSGQASQT